MTWWKFMAGRGPGYPAEKHPRYWCDHCTNFSGYSCPDQESLNFFVQCHGEDRRPLKMSVYGPPCCFRRVAGCTADLPERDAAAIEKIRAAMAAAYTDRRRFLARGIPFAPPVCPELVSMKNAAGGEL